MSSGVPIIVTDLPGQADIVSSNRCGLIIQPDDVSAIANAVSKLASDPKEARAMGRRGRRAAVRLYSWDAAAARTHEILDGIASR
jgi:glycosyltransferase involved in cell wall biosynthesis